MSKTAESIIENAYNIAKEEFPDLPWQPFNITDRGNQIFLEAMNAYADQRVSEARNKTIDEAIEKVGNIDFLDRNPANVIREVIKELSSLKVSTT